MGPNILNYVLVSAHQRYRGALEAIIVAWGRGVHDEGVDPRANTLQASFTVYVSCGGQHPAHVEHHDIESVGAQEERVH